MLFPDHTHLLIVTVYPATALCNDSLQCLTSDFMQLAATGCRRNILHCHCLFEGKCYLSIRVGITIFKIIIWGGISSDIRLEVTFLAPLMCHRKTKFSFICLTITTPNENSEYSYHLNTCIFVLIIIHLLNFLR